MFHNSNFSKVEFLADAIFLKSFQKTRFSSFWFSLPVATPILRLSIEIKCQGWPLQFPNASSLDIFKKLDFGHTEMFENTQISSFWFLPSVTNPKLRLSLEIKCQGWPLHFPNASSLEIFKKLVFGHT